MRASRRAYADAVAWMRSARSPSFRASRWALRALDGSLLAGVIVLGAIGLVSPSTYGSPGAAPVRSGWPWLALLAAVAACGAVALARRRELGLIFRRFREPFGRPLEDDPAFEGAASALSSASGGGQGAFGVWWVWGPATLFVLGVMFAFSAAYFAVDALLARFEVGWAQPVYGVASAALAYLFFRIGGTRLHTWRVALSALRDATGRY